MPGEYISYVDMKGALGRYVYLMANNDPSDNVVLDVIPGPSDDSETDDDYMSEVMVFDPDDESSLKKELTDIIVQESVSPDEVTCYYGILYSGNEIPADNAGIDKPDVVMVLFVDYVFGARDSNVVSVKEFDVYDGETITNYIQSVIEVGTYLQDLDGDNFFVFVGDIKHITCTIED